MHEPAEFDSTVHVLDDVTCNADRTCRVCKERIPASIGAVSVSTCDRVTGELQYHDWYHPACWGVYWGGGVSPDPQA